MRRRANIDNVEFGVVLGQVAYSRSVPLGYAWLQMLLPDLDPIFGSGTNLTVCQMTARAAIIFFVALILIRISGRRSFGQHSALDACLTVLLGAVLSRAVVGASPFAATVSAAFALVVMHRVIALASHRWQAFENLVSGIEVQLVLNGEINIHGMRKALISQHNLEEAVRQSLGDAHVEDVALALLERDGKITVIGKKSLKSP